MARRPEMPRTLPRVSGELRGCAIFGGLCCPWTTTTLDFCLWNGALYLSVPPLVKATSPTTWTCSGSFCSDEIYPATSFLISGNMMGEFHNVDNFCIHSLPHLKSIGRSHMLRYTKLYVVSTFHQNMPFSIVYVLHLCSFMVFHLSVSLGNLLVLDLCCTTSSALNIAT